MINYIIQVILFQLLFLVIYDLLLSKETFFKKNRLYLISSVLISFVLPFLKFSSFKSTISEEYSIVLPEIVLSPQNVIESTSLGKILIEENRVSYLEIIFYVGASIALLIFLIKLFKLMRYISQYKGKTGRIITIPNTNNAFSFFNYIFLGENLSPEKKKEVIEHELVHIKQKHSLDLLFFEVLRIVMWFNPLVYTYQKRITLVHEYLSDSALIEKQQKDTYINHILTSFFDVENVSFVNQFYKHSFIKKRIMMMTKERSKQWNQWKYLLLIPVLGSMILYSSCAETPFIGGETAVVKQLEKRYVMIPNSEMIVHEGEKESYLDTYLGVLDAEFLAEEISIKDLHKLEREEYDRRMKEFSDKISEFPKFNGDISFRLYRTESGRAILAYVLDFNKAIKSLGEKTELTSEPDVPFTVIDKIPTFPGCDEGDKNCFNKKVQLHFVENFDSNLPNKLGLKPGKKRIIVLFKIDKTGKVADIRVKAPAVELEEELTRIIEKLPQMIPGEHNGEKVGVKYTLPLRIDVVK